MEKKLTLTDLIEVETLQQIQDAFSDMTGIAALTADASGVAVTKGSNFTDFCMKYTRQSKLGCLRCERCDKAGALLTQENNNAAAYYRCHAGLVDFAAPIEANGMVVGSFIGGQVLTEPPDLLKISQVAEELGIDKIDYVKAVKKVRIVDEKFIKKAASFLHVIANVLSHIAWRSYELHLSNKAAEKAAQAKSDFLANMSHEIRTPMNAVLGMAEMALREDMSPQARDYIHQIRASGKNLLTIINDILDFSKIEAGKMEIVEVIYEPQSLFSDLASIVNSRIGEKNLEFTMDIPLDLPYKLEGDNIRIQQILINLLNNAVKFTKEGQVHLKLQCERQGEDCMLLKAMVSDTGSGIKERDMDKLFQSFQQVDTKRNRNIEGTGLGLSICQRLLELMDGTIKVESEYGRGSVFSFELPQRIIDDQIPEIRMKKPISAAVVITNPYVRQQLERDMVKVGIDFAELDEADVTDVDMRYDYLITEAAMMIDEKRDFLRENPQLQVVLIADYGATANYNLPNVRVIHKPVYSFGLYSALGLADDYVRPEISDSEVYPFTAPDASILIVDDNEINLTVARGLLEPLNMQVDESTSAKDAIERIKGKKYDLVFMDHMMPHVDGVEATHIIRRMMPQYNDMPIIALTANAIGGTKEMFLREGMNDFVAKPIEIQDIVQKLRKWLPQEKIQEGAAAPTSGQKSEEGRKLPNIVGLDTRQALAFLGSEKLFWTVLQEYYTSIDKKIEVIRRHWEKEAWKDYTVEVHSLKSVSKQVGANEVSALAAEMERAGNEGDLDAIQAKTPKLLKDFAKYKEILAPYFPETDDKADRTVAGAEEVAKMLDQMEEALEAFDSLMIEDVAEEMSGYDYPEKWQGYCEKMSRAAEESDLDGCEDILRQWRAEL